MHREPMVGRASTADHARQEPWAQWLEAGSALACWGDQSCAWFLYRRLRLFWRQPGWLGLRSPFLITVFARCPPAATRSPPSMIVRSILGTNALNPPAAWAAGAPRIHGGTASTADHARQEPSAQWLGRHLAFGHAVEIVSNLISSPASAIDSQVARTANLHAYEAHFITRCRSG